MESVHHVTTAGALDGGWEPDDRGGCRGRSWDAWDVYEREFGNGAERVGEERGRRAGAEEGVGGVDGEIGENCAGCHDESLIDNYVNYIVIDYFSRVAHAKHLMHPYRSLRRRRSPQAFFAFFFTTHCKTFIFKL